MRGAKLPDGKSITSSPFFSSIAFGSFRPPPSLTERVAAYIESCRSGDGLSLTSPVELADKLRPQARPDEVWNALIPALESLRRRGLVLSYTIEGEEPWAAVTVNFKIISEGETAPRRILAAAS